MVLQYILKQFCMPQNSPLPAVILLCTLDLQWAWEPRGTGIQTQIYHPVYRNFIYRMVTSLVNGYRHLIDTSGNLQSVYLACKPKIGKRNFLTRASCFLKNHEPPRRLGSEYWLSAKSLITYRLSFGTRSKYDYVHSKESRRLLSICTLVSSPCIPEASNKEVRLEAWAFERSYSRDYLHFNRRLSSHRNKKINQKPTTPLPSPESTTTMNETAGFVSSAMTSLLIWAHRALSAFIDSRDVVIQGGRFSQIQGHHTSIVININREDFSFPHDP